jgi:predicted  nucleic acid-binding Zn-ribbon protein
LVKALAKTEQDIASLKEQQAAKTRAFAQCQEDLQALQDAASGHSQAITAARTALGHWQSYKAVAKAKEKFAAQRQHIADSRAKFPQP